LLRLGQQSRRVTGDVRKSKLSNLERWLYTQAENAVSYSLVTLCCDVASAASSKRFLRLLPSR
jgi:hypothetical protein